MKTVLIKKIIFYFILLLLLLPAIQKYLPMIDIKPLQGTYQLNEEEHFTQKEFFKGTFQPKFEKGLNDHVGFRNWFVRLNNQLDYSLFSVAHVDNVIAGKENYLFENSYIDSYLGKDFVGEFAIDDQLKKMKFLQDEWKKKNIDLVFVIAPGKADFMPEFLPDRIQTTKKSTTNYFYYSKRAAELNINLVDLKNYFDKMKDTASYPLFPKWSIHWSTYGYTLAADSLAHYIEHLRNIDMPDMVWDGIEIPDTIRNTDNDIGVGMNLFWSAPVSKMGYPILHYEHPEKKRPNVLTIADSYYNGIWDSRIPGNMFHQDEYWYYNKELYKGRYPENKVVPENDLKNEIEKNEVIILMATERNLCLFPFGFVDNAYDLYAPPSKADEYISYNKLRANRISWWEKNLANNPTSLKVEIEKARGNKISIQEMLHREAIWFFESECESSPKKKRLLTIEKNIRGSEELMKGEETKAKNDNSNIDEIILKDVFEIYHKEVMDSLAHIK